MYGITITTPPAGLPVSVERLRRHLRLNHKAEDDQLAEFLQAAVERFEFDTRRPILSTAYRQDFRCFPRSLVLGRGGVTAVTAVSRNLVGGGSEVVSADAWRAEIATSPAAVVFDPVPASERGGFVTFVAGWVTVDAVPALVKAGIRLLAAHLYYNRESHTESDLKAVPVLGWASLCNAYALGLSGDWGQG